MNVCYKVLMDQIEIRKVDNEEIVLAIVPFSQIGIKRAEEIANFFCDQLRQCTYNSDMQIS